VTRQDYITAVGNLVKGELPLGEPEKIMAVGIAVKEYAKHCPRIIVEDESGAAAFDYVLTALAAWSEGFSTIKKVEYPVDDTEAAASVLQDDAWTIYQKPAGKCLRFLEDEPAAAESFRVTYTALHTCTDTACTVEAAAEEAVQLLAAAHFCNMVATYYAQTQDSTIQADSVDHKSKTQEYAARARAYRKMFFDYMGIDEGKTPAASVTRDQDAATSHRGDQLTHPRKYR